MLITFHSKASASITYFGDVAITLLQMMGHSGTVPGALPAAAIPAAIARLQQGLAAAAPDQPGDRPDSGTTDAAPSVALPRRALPLMQLLSASALQKCDVLWEKGAPPV